MDSGATSVEYQTIVDSAAQVGLLVMGGIQHSPKLANQPGPPGGLVLLGPSPEFWQILQNAPEWVDQTPDPIDRWSQRVVTDLAQRLGATPLFPFGGPPYQPFLSWALASGRAWSSPVGMLVHERAGLMVSYRGALAFDAPLDLPPPPAASPCQTCPDQPCRTACPVAALGGAQGYDLAACHSYLDSTPGQDCMTQGCRARRACPVSQRFGRDPAQSALHMKSFHPGLRPHKR